MHTVENPGGGSSYFCQGINPFVSKLTVGATILGLIAFLLPSFFRNRGLLYHTSLTPCVHLWFSLSQSLFRFSSSHLSFDLSIVEAGLGGGGALLFLDLSPPDDVIGPPSEVRFGDEAMMRLLWRKTGENPRSGERSPWLPLINDPLLELLAPALWKIETNSKFTERSFKISELLLHCWNSVNMMTSLIKPTIPKICENSAERKVSTKLYSWLKH